MKILSLGWWTALHVGSLTHEGDLMRIHSKEAARMIILLLTALLRYRYCHLYTSTVALTCQPTTRLSLFQSCPRMM